MNRKAMKPGVASYRKQLMLVVIAMPLSLAISFALFIPNAALSQFRQQQGQEQSGFRLPEEFGQTQQLQQQQSQPMGQFYSDNNNAQTDYGDQQDGLDDPDETNTYETNNYEANYGSAGTDNYGGNRGGNNAQNAQRPTFADIDKLFANVMDRYGIPGASFSASYRGRIIYAKGYGLADVAQNLPFTPDTPFCIASVSKAVDATAILRLVDQGKLQLDDRLYDILGRPNLRGDADPAVREITVRQLLHHSGGWNRNVPYDPKLMNGLARGGKIPFEELLLAAMNYPLDYPPGTKAIYSNFQFNTVRVVVARVSGTSYEKFVQNQIASPLGITDMYLEEPKGHYLPNEAKRYSAQGQELPGGRPPYPLTGPMGSWVCSSNDMVKLLMALDGSDGKQFISRASMQALVAPVPPPVPPRANGFHFGLGMDRVYQNQNGTGYMKNGGVPGVHAQIEHIPGDIDFCVYLNGMGRKDQKPPAIGPTCDTIRRMLPQIIGGER